MTVRDAVPGAMHEAIHAIDRARSALNLDLSDDAVATATTAVVSAAHELLAVAAALGSVDAPGVAR